MIRNLFLKYCEAAHTASEAKATLGTSSKTTVEAYEKANNFKRQLLDILPQEDVIEKSSKQLQFNFK